MSQTKSHKEADIVSRRELILQALECEPEYVEDLKHVWGRANFPRTTKEFLAKLKQAQGKRQKANEKLPALKKRLNILTNKIKKRAGEVWSMHKDKDKKVIRKAAKEDSKLAMLNKNFKQLDKQYEKCKKAVNEKLSSRIFQFQIKWHVLPISPFPDDPDNRFLPIVMDGGDIQGSPGWRRVDINMLWPTELVEDVILLEIRRISKIVKSPLKQTGEGRLEYKQDYLEAYKLVKLGKNSNLEIAKKLEPYESNKKSDLENQKRGSFLVKQGEKFVKAVKEILFVPRPAAQDIRETLV